MDNLSVALQTMLKLGLKNESLIASLSKKVPPLIHNADAKSIFFILQAWSALGYVPDIMVVQACYRRLITLKDSLSISDLGFALACAGLLKYDEPMAVGELLRTMHQSALRMQHGSKVEPDDVAKALKNCIPILPAKIAGRMGTDEVELIVYDLISSFDKHMKEASAESCADVAEALSRLDRYDPNMFYRLVERVLEAPDADLCAMCSILLSVAKVYQKGKMGIDVLVSAFSTVAARVKLYPSDMWTYTHVQHVALACTLAEYYDEELSGKCFEVANSLGVKRVPIALHSVLASFCATLGYITEPA